MAKYFYTEHGNHISNLTTTAQKRRERSVAKISTIPPPLRGTTTKWLILDYYEIANQLINCYAVFCLDMLTIDLSDRSIDI